MLSLRLYLGVKAQTYFVSSSRMFLDNRKTRNLVVEQAENFLRALLFYKNISHTTNSYELFKVECQITTMEADFLSKGTKSHSF